MSNLLEKASIVTTPTAYDNGKILSVKPSIVLGSELITNGDFSNGSAGWTLGSGWSIGDNVANAVDAAFNSQLVYSDNVVANTKYKVSFNVSNYVKGNVRVNIGNVGSDTVSSNGNFTFFLTSANVAPLIIQSWAGGSGTSLSVTNISVKQVIDGDFDFTRNSSATRVNSQGLIEDITSNLPRIDYTGGEGHWLFEPQSTNKIIYSEDFTQWNKSNAITITSNAINSPSGDLNASLLSTTTTNRFIYLTTSSAANSTFSIYVKWKNGSGDIYLSVDGASNYTSVSVTSEWTRVSITPSTSITQVVLRIPTASELYVWGAQAEQNSFSTSYIPTEGSIKTRLQDAAFGAGSSDLINSTEGVLYINVKYLVDNGLSRKISISDGTSANRIYITPFQGLAGKIRYVFTNNYSTQADLHFNTDLTVGKKLAFVWALNRFEVWQNGIKVLEDTSGSTPIAGTFNQVNLGSELGNASENFEGELKALAVFKEALTDAELECLTTI